MKLSTPRFKGVAPKIPPRFLPEDMAQVAEDVEAAGTSLKPLRALGPAVASAIAGAKTLYRFRQNDLSAAPQWFAWEHEVDVVRSQIAGDEHEWTFYTGDGAPKATNKNLAPNSGGPPAQSIPLGVQPPSQAPGATEQEYAYETEPATLTITLGEISSFTNRFGLKVSLDGGQTFTHDVALTGEITASSVADALNGVAGLTAEVVGGNVVVKTSEAGRDVSIHIKYAEDDYTRKSGQGQDAWPPRLRIYQAHVSTIAGWVADKGGRVFLHIHRNDPVPEVVHHFPRGAFNAQILVDMLNATGFLVAGMDGSDVYVETFHPHIGEGAHLGLAFWQENRNHNLTFDAHGNDPHYAEVTLNSTDLSLLNSEDDIQYSLDEGATYTTIQVSSTTPAAVAAVFNDEPHLVAVTNGTSVVIKTAAIGYMAPPPGHPHSRVTLDVRYKTTTANVLLATGRTLDVLSKETRVYAYTWVSKVDDWERESAPSPPSESVDVYPKQAVSVSLPSGPSEAQVTHWRLYRSVNGAYLFVGEESVSTTSLVDGVTADGLGEEMPSMTWTPPPDDLQGLINLPNGMMAGFTGRDLHFCEPYHPHAWPENYQQTIDYPVVGLGRMDTTLAVLTTGVPYIIQGSHPDVLVAVKSDLEQACVSKRSIVSMNGSVFYASPDGLMRLSPSGSELVTGALLTREQWRALNPEALHAYSHDGKYIALYGDRPGGFVFDTREGQLYFHRRDGVSAAYADLQADRLYTVAGAAIRAWGEGDPVTGVWRSKLFTFPQITGFSCAQVEAEGPPPDPPIICTVFAGGQTILEHAVTGRDPFRLPAVQARAWQFELTVPVEIFNVAIAQAMSEIASV
ncbi:hypothetical protein HW932_01975 [Allochromatium humboldtianum]|uniref:Uncharacterized protein n=1 Tax=Allochromatium humboldtianum TaxID=504901 RepID=A0A850R9Z1_9GAMM|nr:hypothetical protein [Allochromatium humboldtianum]NVZ08027.1 hypothetical protein [Allochromatium humboldtianum]